MVDRATAGDDAPMTEGPMTVFSPPAIARAVGVPHLVNRVDIGPALADLVAGYAGRWLDRQRSGFRAAQATLRVLRPAVLFTDREASRTGWLAAARLAGVPSVTVQHGMIYPSSPEYFQARHAGRVRPDVTCVFGEYERDLLVGGAGFEPASVVVTGSPRPLASDDRVESGDREAVRRELGIRDGDRLLVVSVAHNEVLGELHTFGLLERTLGGPLPGIHVVIKLHPQDQGEPRHEVLLRGLAAARGYEAPRVSIVKDLDLYRLLRAADAHLGQYSTVLSDAVVAGTPNLIAVGQAHADSLDYVGAGRGHTRPHRGRRARLRRRAMSHGPGGAPSLPRCALPARGRCRTARGRPQGGDRRSTDGRGRRRDRGRHMRRTVAIIQARTASTRLPGKVLLPLLDEPVLSQVMRRLGRESSTRSRSRRRAFRPTTRSRRLPPRRAGPWSAAARSTSSSATSRPQRATRPPRREDHLRLPAHRPGLIDETIDAFVRDGGDYASNSPEPMTFPRGLDVEVVTIDALRVADREDEDPAWREHVTPWVRPHPELSGSSTWRARSTGRAPLDARHVRGLRAPGPDLRGARARSIHLG